MSTSRKDLGKFLFRLQSPWRHSVVMDILSKWDELLTVKKNSLGDKSPYVRNETMSIRDKRTNILFKPRIAHERIFMVRPFCELFVLIKSTSIMIFSMAQSSYYEVTLNEHNNILMTSFDLRRLLDSVVHTTPEDNTNRCKKTKV